jgi:NAD dependent epimerase/dehydratase family enzyme
VNRDGPHVPMTGAAGFIGSRLVAQMEEPGARVHRMVRWASRGDTIRLPRCASPEQRRQGNDHDG